MLWDEGQTTLSESVRSSVEKILEQYRSATSPFDESSIDKILENVSDEARPYMLAKLMSLDIRIRQQRGEPVDLSSYVHRFPSHSDWLKRNFELIESSLGVDASTCLGENESQAKSASQSSVGPGDRLDRYQLQECLGRGGFGEVWSARDTLLGRMVAIKILRMGRNDEIETSRLLQEGRKLAQLDHEGIVRVLDAGSVDGRFYLVSELMTGGTLESRLNRQKPTVAQSVLWVSSIARALHHAHLCGIIHRDVKPSNILFDANGKPRIADFGIAVSEEELSTEVPQIIGTVHYMSPEQARGESNLADPRTDVYCLGMVLYRMLTGRLPYPEKPLSEYRQHILLREPKPLRSIQTDLPQNLESLCLECLNKQINQRPATALELAERLESLSKANQNPRKPFAFLPVRGVSVVVIVAALILAAYAAIPSKLNLDPKPASIVNPKVVSWQPKSINDSYGYDDTQKRFQFDAFGNALFQTRNYPDRNDDNYSLQLDYEIENGIGQASVFWQLASIDEEQLECWAVLEGHSELDIGRQITIAKFKIGAISGAQGVRSQKNLIKIPVQAKEGRNVLRVSANKEAVRQVWLNDVPVLKKPIPLPEKMRPQSDDFGTGFGGFMGRIMVYNFGSE